MSELIPAAIDALLALGAEVSLTAVGVVPAPALLDGADVADVSGCYLAVGVDGEDDIAGTLNSAQAGLASPRRLDSATVTCVSYAAGGNSDMKPYRDAAYAWYRALRAGIEADPRLGGAVRFAAVVSEVYRPRRYGSSAGAGVEFRVQVTAL